VREEGRKLRKLFRMPPNEIRGRCQEWWHGWQERVALATGRASVGSPSALIHEPLAKELFAEFRTHPFYFAAPGDDERARVRSFQEFFPGRVQAIVEQADRICGGSLRLFGEPVALQEIDWHLDWKTKNRFPLSFYRAVPDWNPLEPVDSKRVWEVNSILDGVFHSIVLDEKRKDEMRVDAALFGIASFKFPVGYKGPQGAGVGYRGIDDGFVFDGFQRAAELAGEGWPAMALVHAENPDIIPYLRKRTEGRYDVRSWHDSRPNFVEAECMKRHVYLAGVAGCPLYVVHVTIREGVDIIAAARSEGQEVIGETCPQYLTHNHDNPTPLMREKPVYTVVNPPIRAREDNERLWEGIRDGVITVVASDTAPNTAALKDVDMWSEGFVPMGLGSNSNMILPVLLSEGVNKRGLPLERVVEVTAYNPARYFGIYPQKGTISVGSDADIVIVDLNKEVTWRAEMSPSNCDWSIYEGWRFRGWPVLTMVRGKVVMEDGRITGEPGYGRYLRRSKGQ